ncbi:MAG: TIGR02530 family flagellar biosynthesis protein [Bacillota bacterium]
MTAGPGEVGRTYPVRPHSPAPSTLRPAEPAGRQASFGQVLDEVLAEEQALRFSGHARRRLAERRIDLSDAARRRLVEAVDRAQAKGAREAVVMLDRLAFVVSVKNRTVITVADEAQLKENVFTNIDSVVFA